MKANISSNNNHLIVRTFPVKGMSCASCSAHVGKALKSVEGVEEVNVNLPMNNARVTFDSAICTPQMLQAAVERMGFELVVEDDVENIGESNEDTQTTASQENTDRTFLDARKRAIGATLTAIPLFLLSLFDGLFSGQEVAIFFIASFSLWRYGRAFYAPAWRLLKHGTCNMDTLVALSISVSYVYSFFNLFFPQWFLSHGMKPHLYFDSVGVITAFILLGRLLESKAKSQTTKAIKQLMQLQPKEVTCVMPNGVERKKKVADVLTGDVLVAHAGERIAVDGEVVKGESYVDESMLSGEPLAVNKSLGAKVMAGTINQNGLLHYQAQTLPTSTLLSQIIHMVQEAQNSKVPIQSLVDKIAAWFVPAIISMALVALGLWAWLGGESGLSHGLVAMVSVLVIACPCSLGLATPTAIIVGMGNGAKHGILVKDATALQTAQTIDTIVLDKTGTITKGKPEVVETSFFSNVKGLLLSIEEKASHPLAEAICQHLQGEDRKCVENFQTLPGHGVKATWEGAEYYVGNVDWISQKNITFTSSQQQLIQQWNHEAHTIVAMANGTQLLALLAINDEVKPTSAKAIAELKEMGITTYMLTGDAQSSAQAIARQVGIDHVKAQVLPTDKALFVKQLQMGGRTVAMVGDGINDSAALAQADLSIAMGQGSDIAINAAMITLLTSHLERIPQAIRLSRRTMNTIRENLFWAFFYNTISVPIAAGLLYPFTGWMLSPMVAGAAMAMSSVSVVMNSLRSAKAKI